MLTKALIFSAGLGTRMGDIGKILPKPLWKIFNKSMLQTQIDFLKTLGITDIYVNIHHQLELIKKEIHDITFLEEPTLLDNGGTLNNLKNHISGHILVVNVDQFFFLDLKTLYESLILLDTYDHLLFSIPTTSTENRFEVENNLLVSIKPFLKTSSNFTYSGTGIINLDKIKSCTTGPFFKAVDYTQTKVFIKSTSIPYFNLGTAKNYFLTMFEFLKDTHPFLLNNQNLEISKIYKNSYNSLANSINLTDKQLDVDNVILMGKTDIEIKKSGIYYNNYYSPI